MSAPSPTEGRYTRGAQLAAQLAVACAAHDWQRADAITDELATADPMTLRGAIRTLGYSAALAPAYRLGAAIAGRGSAAEYTAPLDPAATVDEQTDCCQ